MMPTFIHPAITASVKSLQQTGETAAPPKPDMLLWLSDSRGQYIPRDFAKSFVDRAKNVTGVSDKDWEILEAGPDHEHYWDTWNDVEQGAVITDNDGHRFTIWNSGDCWLIPDGMEWDDETENFKWPDNEEVK